MREERRVCVVVCKQVGDFYRYAVLKRTKNWEGWELVKGHLEDDDPEDAAYTELAEEAGIEMEDVIRLEPLDYTLDWTYERDGEQRKAVCDCFLAEVDSDVFISVNQNPHNEHNKGHFLNFRDARDILTPDNPRELLIHTTERLHDT